MDDYVQEDPINLLRKPIKTLKCVPIRCAAFVVGMANIGQMILFGLYVLNKDFHAILKILPVIYSVYITALFINAAVKARKTRAKKILYLSYLFLSIGIEVYCLNKVGHMIYGQVMYFIVHEQCQQVCKFTTCDEEDTETEQVAWTDFEYEDILSSCVA